MQVRGLISAFGVVAVCVVVAGCGGGGHKANGKAAQQSSTTTTTTKAPPPVPETALRGLLLTAEQLNPVMGTTELAVTRTHNALADDSATMEPRECLAIDGAGQAEVYAGSGFNGVREQTLTDGDKFAHYVDQVVVAFPFAKQATAFLQASAKQWPACTEYRHIQSGSEWTVATISDVDGMLSTVATQENAGHDGWACGRALTVRNNVVVDVNTCSADPKDTAVVIAKQIAAKVPVA